jgi:hypothetical protein
MAAGRARSRPSSSSFPRLRDHLGTTNQLQAKGKKLKVHTSKMASNEENGSHSAGTQPLYLQYPVNSCWEIELSTGETVTGIVYCTDDVSDTVFLQKNLTHTTLATELRILHASQISRSKSLPPSPEQEESSLSAPLPKVQKKALEEREKRAIRLAEESLRHINEKVRDYKPMMARVTARCSGCSELI